MNTCIHVYTHITHEICTCPYNRNMQGPTLVFLEQVELDKFLVKLRLLRWRVTLASGPSSFDKLTWQAVPRDLIPNGIPSRDPLDEGSHQGTRDPLTRDSSSSQLVKWFVTEGVPDSLSSQLVKWWQDICISVGPCKNEHNRNLCTCVQGAIWGGFG